MASASEGAPEPPKQAEPARKPSGSAPGRGQAPSPAPAPAPDHRGQSSQLPRSGSKRPGDPKQASGITSILEQSIIRRGLATQGEIDACKQLVKDRRAQGEPPEKALLGVMVQKQVITGGQAQRLIGDVMKEAKKKHEIPGYEILERLGKGSMGIVYKARQTSVDRIVAVKVLLEMLAQNREFIRRFQREATIAAKLNHPNIVNAIDAGEAHGLYYFVMEFIEGTTIKDHLDKGKVYDEHEALEIVLAVAQAMEHAHSRGLIHRDIKPENVILTKEGNVKLADLGLARLTADEKQAVAEAGMAIGTPYYISPEQVRGSTDVDIRSDIYSLGATLYHMVTGRVPYPGDDPTEVMKRHVDKNAVLEPPDHLNTRLSSGLGEVVETMMAKNRENRYRNPADLIIDLKELLHGGRPLIAEQKADVLAQLAEGEEAEAEEIEGGASSVTDSERIEMAAAVNAKNTTIMFLAIILGLSLVTNVIMLLV